MKSDDCGDAPIDCVRRASDADQLLAQFNLASISHAERRETATFFARGIWRSRSNGDPGTWEQIMAPLGDPALATTERAEFDLVKLPNGATRMYVGVGGGMIANPNPPPAPPVIATVAQFRRNDDVI